MFVAIDVGNSNTVFGLFESAAQSDPVDHWRASTVANRTSDEWMLLLSQFLATRKVEVSDISAVVVASVVPAVTTALGRMSDRLGIDVRVVNWETDTGMPILIDNPREVGADRIANAVAAYATKGGPAIVVDLGTATTLDIVSPEGEYLGGVIIPGIEISMDALFSRAAALSRVELTPPPNVIGKNTIEAVRSGATYGYAAQVDGLCARVEIELGSSCRIISTGGLSGVITPLSERIQLHDPWLTLRGLSLIYQRMQRDA